MVSKSISVIFFLIVIGQQNKCCDLFFSTKKVFISKEVQLQQDFVPCASKTIQQSLMSFKLNDSTQTQNTIMNNKV